jgi:hypothetical protein
MGSIDPGPYYVGSGELATATATTRADLTYPRVMRKSIANIEAIAVTLQRICTVPSFADGE